jgi:hypothetical protein
MNDSKESILKEIIGQYTHLYIWHQEYGLYKCMQKLNTNLQESKYYQSYISLVRNLHSPDNADIEYIIEIAKEQTSGLMEWSYGEKYQNEIPLHKIAEKIKKLVEDYYSTGDEDSHKKNIEKLITLKNKSTSESQVIEIEVPGNTDFNEVYYKYAKIAYNDLNFEEENIGGSVVLSETNKSFIHTRNSIPYYNSKAMHFEEIENEDSLANKILDGSISIINIKIEE